MPSLGRRGLKLPRRPLTTPPVLQYAVVAILPLLQLAYNLICHSRLPLKTDTALQTSVQQTIPNGQPKLEFGLPIIQGVLHCLSGCCSILQVSSLLQQLLPPLLGNSSISADWSALHKSALSSWPSFKKFLLTRKIYWICAGIGTLELQLKQVRLVICYVQNHWLASSTHIHTKYAWRVNTGNTHFVTTKMYADYQAVVEWSILDQCN